jgi:transcription termination/antitermination protein NusG
MGACTQVDTDTRRYGSMRSWYAIKTLSRQEKAAASRLTSIGVSLYLPLSSQLRQWSDRKKLVELPLFPGYVFVRMDLSQGTKLDVLKTPGVVGFVGNASGPLPIPETQIESVRTVIERGAECSPLPLRRAGDKVRVIRGPLAGIEGTLLKIGSDSQLVITIEMIQQSVAITISEQDLEPIESAPLPNV